MISIIIPMYNSESTIIRCLDAIINQNYDGRYEIIVVNDGSTDNSLSIVNNYNKAGRVTILTKENGGPASARNFGLMHCHPDSKWVTFIDSDDYVEPSFLSQLTSLDGDLKMCMPFPKYGEWKDRIAKDDDIIQFKNLSSSKEFASIFKCGTMCPFWNKLFSLDIIHNNNLSIPDIRLLEDADFVFRYIQYCDTVSWKNSHIYNYIHRPGSETSKIGEDMLVNYIRLHKDMTEWFASELAIEIDEFVYPQYISMLRRFIVNNDLVTPKKYIQDKWIRKSLTNHKTVSAGESAFRTLMKYGFFKTAKKLFIKA